MRNHPAGVPGRWRALALGAILTMLPMAAAIGDAPRAGAVGETRYSSIPLASWRVNGVGRAILKVGNTVYVGGSFSQARSPDGSQTVPRRNLAAFDATTGTLIPSFRADTDNAVYDIQTDGNSLFIAGVFTSAGGVSRARIAALDPSTGAVRPGFRADTNGNVYTMSLANGKLYVAGAFTTIGGTARTRVAALSPTTGAVDPTFRPTVDGTALAVAATPDGSTVYIGGPYATVNGQADTDISTLDGRTGATTGPELQNVTGYVDDLEVTPDGQYLMAGHSGVPGVGNRSAVYSTATGSRRWRQTVDGDVQGVALVDGRVFAGFHDGANGDGAARLAGYDLSTGAQDTTFRPSFDRFMGTWAVDGDSSAVVIAGNFSTISGVPVEGFAIFPAATPTAFAAAVWGWESWRYLDDGSNQGTAWRQTGFADGAWKTGTGEFGYGDGDERTRISFGASASNKHITSYFRREFDATSTPASAGIYMRVDDGAVVYVNGVEAARYNMPSGAIVSSTPAASAHDGYGEDDSLYYAIDPALIRTGRNTIAVEIHQAAANSDDLTFFATVTAYASTVVQPPTTTTTTTTTTTITSTTTVVPTTMPPTTVAPTTMAPTTVAPTTTAPTTTAPPAAFTSFDLAASATWSYLDDGSDQGSAWRNPGFDDRTWMTGVGEFGYGDGDERTLVGYGPDASRKYPTTYFRTSFTTSGVPRTLTLSLRIDDGAIVYVNGVEATRFNMPASGVNHLTRANDALSNGGERLDRSFSLDPALIRPGVNVIAVEVHQDTYGSSDITFLASLAGRA